MKQGKIILLSAAFLTIISGCAKKKPTSSVISSTQQPSTTSVVSSSNIGSTTSISSNKESVQSSTISSASSTNSSSQSSITHSSSSSSSQSSITSSSSSSQNDVQKAKYELTGGDGFAKTYITNSSVNPPSSIQDGTILHAWNWSMTTIKSKMKEIADAGYTAVQTSPMQVQKDYYKDNTVKDAWWKLYQPLSFSIATNSSKNQLGTKTQLKEVCQEADKYGIKVIVDVVSNHLAGANTNGHFTLNPAVKEYEPEIYGSGGTQATGAAIHISSTQSVNDNDSYLVTHGNIGGYPDIDTGSSIVKQRVSSLLKEYIDCGVDGFRFDAAKHIETPSDRDGVNSDYWSTVLDEATAYATSKGLNAPYYYGEILNTVGNDRSYDFYSPLMSVTDNKTGNDIRSAVVSGKANNASSSIYQTELPANKVVLWAESHDTYANDENESTYISQVNINKAYALVASRNKASSLYLARPNNMASTILGVSDTSSWKAKEVAAVNKFHNYFVNNNEYLSSSGSFAMNVRYNDTKSGMVLVNCGSGTSVSNLTIPNVMKDGTYKDLVSSNTFIISGGKVSGTMDASQIAVLCNIEESSSKVQDVLKYSISNLNEGANKYRASSFEGTISIANAKNATLKIGTNDPLNVYNGTKITIKEQEYDYTLPLTLTITDLNDNVTTVNYSLTHIDPTSKETMYFTNNMNWDKVYIYMWKDNVANKTWPGVEMTYLETNDYGQKIYLYEYDPSLYDHLIFNNGNGTQTKDISLSSYNGYYISGGSGDSCIATGYNRI